MDNPLHWPFLEMINTRALTVQRRNKRLARKIILNKVLATDENIVKLTEKLGINTSTVKKLLRDPDYYHRWIEEQDKQRVLLTYAFINEALYKLRGEVNKASWRALSTAFGIASDKLRDIGTPRVAQQINIQGGEVTFSRWKKAPFGAKKPVKHTPKAPLEKPKRRRRKLEVP